MKISTKRFAALAAVASISLSACGAAEEATDKAKETAESVADKAEETASSVAEKAEETASSVAEKVEEKVEEVEEKVEEMTGELAGELVGAGASSQAAAMQGWQAGFQTANEKVTVNYDPIGSGGGRKQFLAGGTQFAGSDAALKDEEYEASKESCAGDQGAISLPHYISPIAIPYNLPSLEGTVLKLSPDTVAGIFANKITKWNAPEIAADNPGVDLPDLAVNPVHRADESGTTKNFTDYLAQAAPDTWTWGKIEGWDAEGPGGGEGAPQTSGMVQAVTAGEGSIGYADASQIGNLPAAAVGVAGSFVEYSPEAAAKLVDNSNRAEGRSEFDFSLKVNRTPDSPDTYPIALVSYHIVCLEYKDQATVDLVKGFMNYVSSNDGQKVAAEAAGSAPISAEIQAQIAKSIDAIKVAG